MKVKELRELLNEHPDDREVLICRDFGPEELGTPETTELLFLKHGMWNNRPHEWFAWNYPSPYPLRSDEEIVKTELCLVFGY